MQYLPLAFVLCLLLSLLAMKEEAVGVDAAGAESTPAPHQNKLSPQCYLLGSLDNLDEMSVKSVDSQNDFLEFLPKYCEDKERKVLMISPSDEWKLQMGFSSYHENVDVFETIGTNANLLYRNTLTTLKSKASPKDSSKLSLAELTQPIISGGLSSMNLANYMKGDLPTCGEFLIAELSALQYVVGKLQEFTNLNNWIALIRHEASAFCVKQAYGYRSPESYAVDALMKSVLHNFMKATGLSEMVSFSCPSAKQHHQRATDLKQRGYKETLRPLRLLQGDRPSSHRAALTYQITLWVSIVLVATLLLTFYIAVQNSATRDPLLYTKLSDISKK